MTKPVFKLKTSSESGSPTEEQEGETVSRFQMAGGSQYDDFNRALVHQVLHSGWYGHNPNEKTLDRERNFNLAGLMGVAPEDTVEGMLAAQMMATHNAAMECYRRAMIPEQGLEARDMNLSQANKLTRSYATLVQALDKHRGKGQQKVTVEHVHINDGGQAIIGNVGGPSDGGPRPPPTRQQLSKAAAQPMAMASEIDPVAMKLVPGVGGD